MNRMASSFYFCTPGSLVDHSTSLDYWIKLFPAQLPFFCQSEEDFSQQAKNAPVISAHFIPPDRALNWPWWQVVPLGQHAELGLWLPGRPWRERICWRHVLNQDLHRCQCCHVHINHHADHEMKRKWMVATYSKKTKWICTLLNSCEAFPTRIKQLSRRFHKEWKGQEAVEGHQAKEQWPHVPKLSPIHYDSLTPNIEGLSAPCFRIKWFPMMWHDLTVDASNIFTSSNPFSSS